MEKIKDEATFGDSVQLLTAWLERGDCNKRTAGNFYSMIQSTNSHVRRYGAGPSDLGGAVMALRGEGGRYVGLGDVLDDARQAVFFHCVAVGMLFAVILDV